MLAPWFYSSRPWRNVRLAVLDRDGWRCTVEETTGERCEETLNLHVHHLVEPADELDPAALDPENLLTVCGSHHSVWHHLRRGTARCVRLRTARPARRRRERAESR